MKNLSINLKEQIMTDKDITSCKQANYLRISILILGVLLVISCNEQARGFALPDGNVEEKQTTRDWPAMNVIAFPILNGREEVIVLTYNLVVK